jgi:MOSC domain-containing protein YiiM
MARLLSLNVGMPQDVPWQGRTVHTGIFKYPVDGPRMVRRLNIDSDGQGDLNGHGGEIRAVLVYQRQSYEHWRQHLGRDDLEYGQFGENFTVDGLPDDEVYIGDRYRIGEAEFEVTQPRVTCFRVGMRLGEPEMPALLVAHHRPGFYFRVITEGHVQAGDEIIRTRIGRHRMSVATIDALLYLPDRDIDQLRKAVDIPALSPGWQASFHDLLDAAEHQSPASAPPAGAEPAEPTGWAGFQPLRVSRIVPESATVASIHLAAPDGAPLPRPKPGQYLTLRVAGAGDPPPVCHLPSGTSKWNTIEHRLFCHITTNWRGRPLSSHEVIVATIAATTTRTGLRVQAALDEGRYPTGVKVSDTQMAALPIARHAFHGDWNYTLHPGQIPTQPRSESDQDTPVAMTPPMCPCPTRC